MNDSYKNIKAEKKEFTTALFWITSPSHLQSRRLCTKPSNYGDLGQRIQDVQKWTEKHRQQSVLLTRKTSASSTASRREPADPCNDKPLRFRHSHGNYNIGLTYFGNETLHLYLYSDLIQTVFSGEKILVIQHNVLNEMLLYLYSVFSPSCFYIQNLD